MVTYLSIGTLYLSIISPSTQCECPNYSSLAAEHIVVTFGLKVEDAFHSFEEVQMKIEEVEDRTTCYFTNNQVSLGRPVCVVKFVRIAIWGDSFWAHVESQWYVYMCCIRISMAHIYNLGLIFCICGCGKNGKVCKLKGLPYVWIHHMVCLTPWMAGYEVYWNAPYCDSCDSLVQNQMGNPEYDVWDKCFLDNLAGFHSERYLPPRNRTPQQTVLR